jgi:hypothetical protein
MRFGKSRDEKLQTPLHAHEVLTRRLKTRPGSPRPERLRFKTVPEARSSVRGGRQQWLIHAVRNTRILTKTDQSPSEGFKFSRGIPMRTTVFVSVVFHRITSFPSGKEVVPSTLPGLAGQAHSKFDTGNLLENGHESCPNSRQPD